MKIKVCLLLLIFLTFQISSIKALSLNERVEAAAAWISSRKTLDSKGFLSINEHKLYVEENALIFLALTLYRKTFTSNRYNEEIKTALSFILSSQETLKKDFRHYYDLDINAWGPSGKLFYWNAYVIEALSYSSFQLRFYGNLNESELIYCEQAIASVKSFLNAWGQCQKNDGSWVFEYENKTSAELSENSALLTSLLYLALYEHFWGSDLNAFKKYVESAEKTLDWILNLQELNPESWGYGGFYQNKEKNLQDAYSNAKAAFALNSYLRVIPSLKEDFKSKYYKVRDSLTLWVKEFIEKMVDEYYGIYNSRGLLGVIKYPKGLLQASLTVTTLVETWIDMGDSKYRSLTEKMLNWIIGENEVKKDLQSTQGGFYEGIQKNQAIINQLSLTTTALTLTALINCLLIGVPEIPFIQPILALALIASFFIISNNKRFKK
ncbi:MAG: hypothetical protein QXZ53_02325 [Candidatus Bathyarchaeia archaeon]